MAHFARIRLTLWLAVLLALTGCSGGAESSAPADSQQGGGTSQKQGGATTGYPELKTMVLDILHSKDGMTTLKDTISSPEFKRFAAITPSDVQAALEKSLSKGPAKPLLQEQMKDPQFASVVAGSIKSQLTDIQRGLMKDPSYQKELLALMESPEFMKTQFTLLKSPEYRKEIMKIMTEALQAPSFRLLFQDSMKEAVKSAVGGQQEKVGQGQQQKKDKSQEDNSSGNDKGQDGEDQNQGEGSGEEG